MQLLRFALLVALAASLAACASHSEPVAAPAPTPALQPAPAPAPVEPPPAEPAPAATLPLNADIAPPGCPACQACASVAPPACAPAAAAEPAPAPDKKGRLEAATWQEIPVWADDSLDQSLPALLQSCVALGQQVGWQQACAAAAALPRGLPNDELTRFFQNWFVPYRVLNADNTDFGLVTGYYEPLLFGSRTPDAQYKYPLYATPDDMLTVDLSSVYPDLKHRRLRGRLEGNRVVPYYTRAELEDGSARLKGKELVWVNDPIEVLFLHIQGSGQVQLAEGGVLRVGYADQNGHPFRSVGGYLIRAGELRREEASLQGIRAWAKRNPAKLDAFLNYNPSFVFFKPLPEDLTGPLGTLGVPLTSERSLAVDQRVVPLGVPVFLSTTWPNTAKPLNRMMLAQDTGGAIAGGVRADFYWGFGDAALRYAGVMKQRGKMWALLPKGVPVNGANGISTVR